MTTLRFEKFRRFVVEHHTDQKYGKEPYATHLDRVVSTINKHAQKHHLLHTLQFCAIGHDLIEDTDATKIAIQERTNQIASCAIELISDPDAPTRSERKTLAYTRFKTCSDATVKSVAATTKLADRLDNMKSCLNDVMAGISTRKAMMYLKEQNGFMDVFENHCLFKELTEELNGICLELETRLAQSQAT